MTETEAGRDAVKRYAMEIVNYVDPEDTFVVEEGFDSLADDWHRAGSQDEGRFLGGLDATTFSAVVVPFLFVLLGDVVKDVIKDQAKKGVAAVLERLLKRQATEEDTARLRREIDSAIEKSRFSAGQKGALRAGFVELFERVASSA